MGFIKKLSLVEPNKRYKSLLSNTTNQTVGDTDHTPSILPKIYAGYPQRIDRYSQYDQMDTDPEVNIALDTIAEFSTQRDESEPNNLFRIVFNEDPAEGELIAIKRQLRTWCKINKFGSRLFRMFRDTIKYGDQFFIRDPDTMVWNWVNQIDVTGVMVNPAKGNKITDYLIKNFEFNCAGMNVTPSETYGSNIMGTGTNTLDSNMSANRFGNVHRGGTLNVDNTNASAVDANFVVHLSLDEGLNAGWPFAISILESVYRVYRQKELLEDAVIIYRIQRAPERRVFYVDVGDTSENRAHRKVEQFKNSLRQRKIPTRNGGDNQIDAAYNPMCLALDTKIPLLDGRTMELSELIKEHEEGKTNWAYSCNPTDGEIVPGLITWAGITRKNTDVIKITLDNDKSFVVTPDHKIPVQGKGFIEASKLTVNDSLFELSEKKYSNLTKIKKIEFLSEKIDVGTLTIDYHEKYHNYHTFAIDAGIFVKNSQIEDLFIPVTPDGRGSKVDTLPGGQCITLDTKIPLLDSRVLTLQELIEEFDNGIINWVFSCNPVNGEMYPAPITWAGITRKNATVIKIKTNKGNLICTPDHKIPVMNKGYIRADSLKIYDNLISHDNESHLFYDNVDKIWKNTKDYSNEKLKLIGKSNLEFESEDEILHKTSKGTYVIKIEKLDYVIDTGDITIDGNGEYYGFHNFAIESGFYIHNSIGVLDDLLYFNQKLIRGLRIPASYIPSGTTDTNVQFNDGRAGVAFIQEFRFAEYCKRFQRLIAPVFDREFKLFLQESGCEIDSNLFDLDFNEPQHFSEFAKAERISALLSNFTSLVDVNFISRRKLLMEYLGWTEEDIIENEKFWKEENIDTLRSVVGDSTAQQISASGTDNVGLDAVGFRDDDNIGLDSGFDEEESGDIDSGSDIFS